MITEEEAYEKVKQLLAKQKQWEGIEFDIWGRENKYGWIFNYQDARAYIDESKNYDGFEFAIIGTPPIFISKNTGNEKILFEYAQRDYEEEEFKDL